MKKTSTYFIYEHGDERRFARNYPELYEQLKSEGLEISHDKLRHVWNQVGRVNANDFEVTFFDKNIIYRSLIARWFEGQK